MRHGVHGPRVLLLANVVAQERSGVGRWASQMLPRLANELAARSGRLVLAIGRDTRIDVPPEAEVVEADLPAGPPLLRWHREGPSIARLLEAARAARRPFDWLHTGHLPFPRRVRRTDVRTSWLVHDLRQLDRELVGAGRTLVAPSLYRAALRRADLVCTVSEHVAGELRERFRRDAEACRVAVVPNGSDHLPLFPRAPSTERPYVLGVGHLEQRKNVATVLRALALDPELPSLVWVGRGPDRGALQDLAHELRVAERVLWIESVDDADLARLYASAGACVVPSLLEGFGITAVEALRAGTPLAYASAGALPEVVGTCGRSFAPEDPRALAAALREALSERDSADGRERARLLLGALRAHPGGRLVRLRRPHGRRTPRRSIGARSMNTRRTILRGTLGLAALALTERLAAASAHTMTKPTGQDPDDDAPAFRISLAEWSLHRALHSGELDHLGFAPLAKREFGIEAVEYVSTFFAKGGADFDYLREVRAAADGAGVRSLLIMVDGEGALGAADDEERRRAIERHFKWIAAAAFLGCHSIRVNAAGGGDLEEHSRRAADSLHRLCLVGDEYGVNVIVENHGGPSSNGAWLARTIERADHPRCGTLPDFGNFSLGDGTEYDRYRGVSELMPFAKAVSAKSHEFDADGNETRTDYARMLRIVRDAGYRGFVGIEYEGGGLLEMDGIRATKALLERVRETIDRR
ncbi:MAG: glycosyltransferase [Planctomycetota bacterium]